MSKTCASFLIGLLSVTSLMAGCGTGTLGGVTPLKSAITAKAKKASEPSEYGRGWKSDDGAPIVNDLGSRRALSLGFRLQAEAPRVVDLRPLQSPVRNQYSMGACTGFALTALAEALQLRGIRSRQGDVSKEFKPLSPLYLYNRERMTTGEEKQDNGARLFIGINLLATEGALSEEAYPYPASWELRNKHLKNYHLTRGWTWDTIKQARTTSGGRVMPILRLSELKASLDEGYPVVFGFQTFDSLDSVGEDGMIPLPHLTIDRPSGGHAILAVGYDEAREVLILKNSWGTNWGDKGYAYMPYKYFNTDFGFVKDGWSMREQ